MAGFFSRELWSGLSMRTTMAPLTTIHNLEHSKHAKKSGKMDSLVPFKSSKMPEIKHKDVQRRNNGIMEDIQGLELATTP